MMAADAVRGGKRTEGSQFDASAAIQGTRGRGGGGRAILRVVLLRDVVLKSPYPK